MNKTQARSLLDRAKESWKLTGDLVAEIVTEQAWLPLGYASFIDMWSKEFGGIPLAMEVRPAVVYEMFAAGASDAEVAFAVDGVGAETAASLREQQEMGVPAADADPSPKRRRRNMNERRAYDRHIDVLVTESQYETVAAVAGDADVTVTQWARDLILAAVVDAAEEVA